MVLIRSRFILQRKMGSMRLLNIDLFLRISFLLSEFLYRGSIPIAIIFVKVVGGVLKVIDYRSYT